MNGNKRKYNFSVNNYFQALNVPKEKNLNGFTVTNLGDTAITVNNKILFPSLTPATVQGDSMSFGGNEGEIYIGKITISIALPSATPNVEIVQKFYVEDNC